MNSFTYSAPGSAQQAVSEHAKFKNASYLGGGTNLLDNLKLGVEQPDHLIDVRHLGLDRIEALPDGGVRIGASVRNTALAYDDRVRSNIPRYAKQSWLVRVPNSETPLRLRAIFCSERAVTSSATPLLSVISAFQDRAVPPFRGSTAFTPY